MHRFLRYWLAAAFLIGALVDPAAALSINDGGVSVNGPGSIVNVNEQIFTATGTYIPSPGLRFAIIECVGGGGGGGGVTGTASEIFAAGGGGGGGYSRVRVTPAQVGTSQAVTIGAGGPGGTAGSNNGSAGTDTSVGSLCIGKGASGGAFASAVNLPTGGAGGVIGTGDFSTVGGPGGVGFYDSINATITTASGTGGNSFFGGGAVGVGNGNAGTTATGYGGGGSGGNASSAANFAGGAGFKGAVIITEYLNQ